MGCVDAPDQKNPQNDIYLQKDKIILKRIAISIFFHFWLLSQSFLFENFSLVKKIWFLKKRPLLSYEKVEENWHKIFFTVLGGSAFFTFYLSATVWPQMSKMLTWVVEWREWKVEWIHAIIRLTTSFGVVLDTMAGVEQLLKVVVWKMFVYSPEVL